MTQPLVAVSLKMYLSAAATRAWVTDVAELVARLDRSGDVEVVVLPTFPLLESTSATLASTPVRWGAQDVAASGDGSQTGEVSADVLAELGCRYVEVGHAERRRLFGEGPDVIAAKLTQVASSRLVPLYCLGEAERADSAAVARRCCAELDDALATVRAAAEDPEIVVAYEAV